MLLQIDHITRYFYSEPANGIIQKLKLTPQHIDSQQILNWRIDVDVDGRLVPSSDAYGNICHIFYAEHAVDSLTVHVTGTVQTQDMAGRIEGAQEKLPASLYLRSTPLTASCPTIAGFAEVMRRKDDLETLHTLMLAVHQHMQFEPGITDCVTDAKTAFEIGRGVCQDLSQIFITASRHLGYPARYVSGHYAAPDHPEQEASHAWAEVMVPDLGWVAFDPTHAMCPADHHVRVAIGLDSLEAAPVRGSRRGGGMESLLVGVHGRESGTRSSAQLMSQKQMQA